MKRLLILIGVSLFTPGSPSNPYVIERQPDGRQEMRSLYPGPKQDIFTPGSVSNPYVIEKDPATGNTLIHTKFPNFTSKEDE